MTSCPISVVICAYASERWDALVAAVRSVESQEVGCAEIVVAVDHNPELAARIRRELPALVVVENQGVRGLSGARNSGIAVARGSVIAFLDDDAVAAPGWLSRLWRGYDEPNTLGVGGWIEPYWVERRPRWFPEEFDWVVGCTYRGLPERPAPVRNLIGANMSFRREVFASVGGFRSGIGRVGTLPVGCEETEFCIRVHQRYPDAILLFEPRARVHHLVPADRGTWRYFARRCFAEGRSKSLVSRLVGANDGLASERSYTLRTLPSGVLHGLASTIRHADPAGAASAGVILAGLSITTAGYLASRLRVSRKEEHHAFGWPTVITRMTPDPAGDDPQPAPLEMS